MVEFLLQSDFFVDNQRVRIRFISKLIQRSGLVPWVLEYPFPDRLISTFLVSAGRNQGGTHTGGVRTIHA